MRRRAEITVRSRLQAPATAVWERIVTPAGVNDEMRPLLRMTLPRGLGELGIESVIPGEPVGRSWILLFGLIPFDYDDLLLERIDPGRGFLERSTMLSQRLWEHERSLEPVGDGACLITDRVAWEPRPPLPGALLAPLIGAFFGHRHARLRRRFGGEPAAAGE
jgi:hypothetical protein